MLQRGAPRFTKSEFQLLKQIYLHFSLISLIDSLRKTQLETCPRVKLVLAVNAVHHNSIMSSMNNIEHVSTYARSMLWPDVDYNYDVYYHDHHLTKTNNIE